MKIKRWLSLVLSAVTVVTLAVPERLPAKEANQKELAYEVNAKDAVETADISADLSDSDELLEGYVREQFFGNSGISAYGNFADDKLTGLDLQAYRILKQEIEKIAKGEREHTQITMSLPDLGITKTKWTASDLGVDYLASLDENHTIQSNPDAVQKMWDMISPDMSEVLNYLRVDCPFEFYWYDKTSATRSSYSKGFGISSEDGGQSWIFNTEGIEVTYSFPVAEEYRGETDYTIRTSLLQSVQTAADNAKAIVDKFEGYSDYDKLVNYRKEICDLVNYNHGAADNEDTPYGNPWQLIWVFDQDPATDVVCEGYAKAFQYLCDMSDFFDPQIACYTVTGTMGGGTGAGGHMWNIVTMEDGKHYIVDVTNCDEGSVGAPDHLFLAGAQERAVSSGAGQAYEYTVSIPGQTSIVYRYYEDTQEMYGEILRISDSGFRFDYKDSGRFDSGIEWTLDEAGFLNIKGSGDMPEPSQIDDTTYIPWSNHADDIHRVVVQEGITSVSNWAFAFFDQVSEISLPNGLKKIGTTAFAGSRIERIRLPESLEVIDGLAFAFCRNLKEINIPSHVTEIGAGAFMECDSLSSITLDASHPSFVFEDGVLLNKEKTKALACLKAKSGAVTLADTVQVVETYAFYGCSHLVSVTLPEHVREIGFEAFKDCTSLKEVSFLGACPTFHQEGEDSVFSGDTLTLYYPKEQEASWSSQAETGFSKGEVTFTALCAVHDWETQYTVDREATCTIDGMKSIHCSVCGLSKEDTRTPISASHRYGDWTVAAAATCTEDGTEQRVCSVCENAETRAISKTGHHWEDSYTMDQAATCTTAGKQSIHCSNCGAKSGEEQIPALGHSMIKTEDKDGIVYTCSLCGRKFIDAAGKTEFTGGGLKEEIKVNSIALSVPSTQIAAGKKVTIEAAVLPANAKNPNLKWESSNPKYAVVSAGGVVTTKKAGAGKKVTITASALDQSGKSGSVTLKLMKNGVKKIQIVKPPKQLKAGKNIKLKTKVTGTGNGKKFNKKLRWTSSNPSYAAVDAKGKVKALKAGAGKKVTITATALDGTNKKAKVKIKIVK